MSEIERPPSSEGEAISSKHQQKNNRPLETVNDPWRRVEVGLTFCIFISYIVLGVVGYFQYDAARKATRRAMQANLIARSALAESQKAFVYVSSIRLEPTNFPTDVTSVLNGEGEIVIRFVNSGNTPALHFLPATNFICGKPPINFDYPDFKIPPKSFRPTFIAPKQEWDVRIPIKLGSVIGIREGNAPLKVYGHVDYIDDIFKQKHRTWFCADYAAHWDHVHFTGTDMFNTCEEHNCADDDCPKPWSWQPRTNEKSSCAIAVELPAPTPTPAPAQ